MTMTNMGMGASQHASRAGCLYPMQVNKVRMLLRARNDVGAGGVNVGSVDDFQGQVSGMYGLS